MHDSHDMNRKFDQSDASVAKKLFFGGCAFLPWLWILLLWNYRDAYFSPTAPEDLKKCMHLCVVSVSSLVQV